MRWTAVAGALAAVALAATGCGSSDESASSTAGAATTSAKSTPVKAAILVTSLTDYQTAELNGFRDAIKGTGGTYKTYNANFDPSVQTKQCQDAVTSGRYNVIVLGVYDPPTGVPCVQAAKAADIPVVAWGFPIGTDPDDKQPQVDGVVGGLYLTANDTVSDTIDLTKGACKGLNPCKVLMEIISSSDPASQALRKRVAAEVPNIDLLQTYATAYDPAQVSTKMPDLLSAHPDVQVILANADSQALAAVPALKSAGLEGKVKLLGAGGSRLGVQAIKDGTMFGTTASWPYKEGEIVAKMAQQAVDGKPLDPNAVDGYHIDTPSLLTKANIDQFTPEWGPQPKS